MRTITETVYNFDELGEEAKERARDWYREGAFDYEWWEYTYEDAKTIGLEITSFDVDRYEIEGKLLEDVKTICARIIANHGKACETYKLAKSIDRRRVVGEMATESFRRALLQEYLRMLRIECEYIVSAEVVDENIKANEYTFTEGGKRRG